MFKQIYKIVNELFFPTHCIHCRARGKILCCNCERFCRAPERDLPKNIFALYDYRDPHIRKILWAIKYENKYSFASIFGEPLYNLISDILINDYLILDQNIILIPIPVSEKRKKERGYNQALVLAKEIMKNQKNNKIQILDILVKEKNTERQAKIKNRATRLKNVVGSMNIKKDILIPNGTIILIDDITTTGATFREAIRALKPITKNHTIICVAVAH